MHVCIYAVERNDCEGDDEFAASDRALELNMYVIEEGCAHCGTARTVNGEAGRDSEQSVCHS